MTYRAPRWLPNRHLMTIYAALARVPRHVPLYRERWELPDGDFLDVDRMTGARPSAPLVIICHGLEGSSRAGYVRGVLAGLRTRGYAACAINFRSCSGTPNRLQRFYHSGETGDLAYAVEKLGAERPDRRLALVGFSLGGNVVTKYLGETGAAAPAAIRVGAVVSVPFDLAGCAVALDGPGLPAYLYRERFLRKLRPKALEKAARFPGSIDVERVKSVRLLRAFDDAATAPLHGFADAAEYYARSSSRNVLAGIARPLLVLSSEDDPFIPKETLPLEALRKNPQITLELHADGGHVGFLAGPPWRTNRYAEERVVEFVAEHLPEHPPT